MEGPNVKLNLTGSVKPPDDMVECAKKSLGDEYPDFVSKYPGEITPQKLVHYIEVVRDGTRS